MRQRRNSRLFHRDTFRRLNFESLEPRRVLAGNVTAEVIDGDLIITGDDAANTISVGQTDIGSYVIAWDGAPPGFVIAYNVFSAAPIEDPTWINRSFQNIELHGVTGRIVIHAGGGDDRVTIHHVVSPFTAPGDLIIDGGAGYDYIEVGEIPQQNPLHLLGEFDPPIPGFSIASDLQIDAGDGGGNIYVRPGTIGGALQIATGSAGSEASNSIGVAGVTAGSFSLNGGDGTELVLIVSLSTSGPVAMAMGAGNDDVQMHSLDLDGDGSIDLGAGSDRVTVMGTVSGDLTVQGGAGSDSLILGGETRPERSIRMVGNPFWVPPLDGGDPVSTMQLGAGGPLLLDGNLTVETAGGDFLNLQHTRVVGSMSIDSGESTTPEFIRIRHVSAGETSIFAADGNDIVNIAFMTARNRLTVDLAGGDDFLSATILGFLGVGAPFPNPPIIPIATILGQDGRDGIFLDGCYFESVCSIEAGNGDNDIVVGCSVFDSLGISGGHGSDNIRTEFSLLRRLGVNGGQGNDNVLTRVCAIDEVFYDMGAGDDSIELFGSVVRELADADGGAGFDTLNRRHSRIKQFNATNFEAGNDAGLLFL
ncbi:MAG: hypothetical protein WD894_23020 [Pirellulales bacterium]